MLKEFLLYLFSRQPYVRNVLTAFRLWCALSNHHVPELHFSFPYLSSVRLRLSFPRAVLFPSPAFHNWELPVSHAISFRFHVPLIPVLLSIRCSLRATEQRYLYLPLFFPSLHFQFLCRDTLSLHATSFLFSHLLHR